MNYSELKQIFRELKSYFSRDDLTAHIITKFTKLIDYKDRTPCLRPYLSYFHSDNKSGFNEPIWVATSIYWPTEVGP